MEDSIERCYINSHEILAVWHRLYPMISCFQCLRNECCVGRLMLFPKSELSYTKKIRLCKLLIVLLLEFNLRQKGGCTLETFDILHFFSKKGLRV